MQAGTLPPTVFAEALACLACLDIPGHDYAQLMCSTGIHTFLAELATAGGGCPAGQDSMLLGVVEAVGVLCADEACAGMLASAGLVSRQERRGFTHLWWREWGDSPGLSLCQQRCMSPSCCTWCQLRPPAPHVCAAGGCAACTHAREGG